MDVDKLLELVDKAGFWAAQSTEPQPDENSRKYYVLDGAWWMLEGVQNGSFHYVFRRNPKPTPITEIGCYLAKNLVKSNESVIPMPGCAPATQTSEHRCNGNISLRLFATQTVMAVCHSVPLRVEIQNCGQKELSIAIANEENLGFPANLPLVVRDSHGTRVSPMGYSLGGAFGSPYEWWIPLPPGYLYGRDVTVTQYHSAFVNTPGEYEVTVQYSGIPRPAPFGTRSRKSASVPPEGSEVFTGRVESNAIAIEIVAPAADKR